MHRAKFDETQAKARDNKGDDFDRLVSSRIAPNQIRRRKAPEA
jgi:hypothetical protein